MTTGGTWCGVGVGVGVLMGWGVFVGVGVAVGASVFVGVGASVGAVAGAPQEPRRTVIVRSIVKGMRDLKDVVSIIGGSSLRDARSIGQLKQ